MFPWQDTSYPWIRIRLEKCWVYKSLFRALENPWTNSLRTIVSDLWSKNMLEIDYGIEISWKQWKKTRKNCKNLFNYQKYITVLTYNGVPDRTWLKQVYWPNIFSFNKTYFDSEKNTIHLASIINWILDLNTLRKQLYFALFPLDNIINIIINKYELLDKKHQTKRKQCFLA